MKFTLIYDGDLPASGNSSKASYASAIRNVFHDQLADLWNCNVIFRQLARSARTRQIYGGFFSGSEPIYTAAKLPDYDGPIPVLRDGQTDLCAPIAIPNTGNFIPAVRHSLYLACSLDILFLRHDEPLRLLKAGGDLDNRIKTLFDGLKMPANADELGGIAPTADPLYVLLEDDALIYDLSIKTGKLLGRGEKKKHEVRLSVDVTIKVLRVFEQNQCLVGG